MDIASQIYRFGEFSLDAAERQLRCGKEVVFLRPKPFETLLYLVKRHGHLVRKEELMDQVWAETSVTEGVLTNAIAELRRALGDEVDRPRYITTVPRLGYKFIAPTDVELESSPAPIEAAPGSAVVVLPFANISADPENEHFCDGLSEELINALTRTGKLRVVARTSAFTFKGRGVDVREIGRQLNVGSVLEGSVRKAGDRLRISVQLIDATNGYHVWSEQFDRRLKDVFAIQDEIADAVLVKLKIPSSTAAGARASDPPTLNMDAYQTYLKGRSFWHRRYQGFVQKAMACFKQAIEKDKDFALPYTGLADCYYVIGAYAGAEPKDVFSKSIEMAEKALDIDGELAEAHASRAIVAATFDWDWAAAERGFRRSIALSPGVALTHLWYGHCLSHLGRSNEAVEQASLALDLDPLSPTISANHAFTLYFAGRYEAAWAGIKKTLELDPYHGVSHFYLGLILAQRGDYAEAIKAYQKALDMTSGSMHWAAGSMGGAYARTGNRRAAARILEGFEHTESYVPPTARAIAYAGMGEDDEVYEWLDRGYAGRDALMCWIKVEHQFDRLRPQPRFQALMRRIGLC